MSWGPCSVVELTEIEQEIALRSMTDHVRKSAEKKQARPKYRLVGIATTQHEDLQGDTIHVEQMDWQPFLKRGFINDDHGKGAREILGYPTRLIPVTLRDGPRPVKAMGVEGYLFDTKRACEMAELAMAMDGTDRQMGFSPEGPPPVRDLADRHQIIGGKVEHLAMTPWPVNPHTRVRIELVKSAAALAKSMTASMRKGATAGYPGDSGPGSLRPLMPESLRGLASQGMDIDIGRLRALADGWQPANKDPRRPRRTLSKSDAFRVIRARLPHAHAETVERIYQLARAGG